MKLMHGGRLDGVNVARNPQEREREAPTCVVQTIIGRSQRGSEYRGKLINL